MEYSFKAVIYKTGINWCVDVPDDIVSQLLRDRGYIYIKGTINGFFFRKCLVPVKDSFYRLFVNLEMMKGGHTEVGLTALFRIEQDVKPEKIKYDVPKFLMDLLQKNEVFDDFVQLTPYRKQEILKYLLQIKSEPTRTKNLERLLTQLKNKETNVRIP